MQPVENPSWKNPFDTCKREVEAAVATARYVEVASEEVEKRPKILSNVEDADIRSPTVEVGEIEMSPVEFAALNARLSTNWVPHASLPVVELYWRNVSESSHHPRPVWKRPLETVSWEVEAAWEIARYEVEANVVDA